MNKIFGLIALFALVAVSYSRNLPVKAMTDGDGSDYGVKVFELVDNRLANAADSMKDTIAIGGNNVYGPIPITQANCNAAKGIQIYAYNNLLASGDSISVGWAPCSSPFAADVIGYTTLDTLIATTGEVLANIDLTSRDTKYVFVRILNFDATRVELSNRIRCVVKYDCK